MPHTLHFQLTRTIRAPLDDVWKVLGDFGNEHRWARGFLGCERDTAVVSVGTARICTLAKPLMGRTRVREELTEYQPGVSLAYTLDGPAGPFASAASRWTTKRADEDSTVVTVEGHFSPRHLVARLLVWPLAKPVIRRLTGRVLGELEAYVLAQRGTHGTPA